MPFRPLHMQAQVYTFLHARERITHSHTTNTQQKGIIEKGMGPEGQEIGKGNGVCVCVNMTKVHYVHA